MNTTNRRSKFGIKLRRTTIIMWAFIAVAFASYVVTLKCAGWQFKDQLNSNKNIEKTEKLNENGI